MKRIFLTLVLSFLSFGANAATSYNMTFESQPVGGDLGPILDNGFYIGGGSFNALYAIDAGGNNVVAFCVENSVCGATQPLIIENAAGNDFDLLTFDFATDASTPPSFLVTGILAAGGTVQSNLISPPFFSYYGTGVMSTYAFDGSWTGLSRIEISWSAPTGLDSGFIDNISLQVVPIPAAVYLFASGLGLLGWFRRRA